MKIRTNNTQRRMRRGSAPGGRAIHSSFVIRHSSVACAFTLLEVIIACAIFFMVAFAVLELVTQGLSAARQLEQREPDCGLVAAAFSLTNRWEDGDSGSGTFEDIAPGLYPGYSWDYRATEAGSNGLYQVDYTVYHKAGKKGASESHMSVLVFTGGGAGLRNPNFQNLRGRQ